MIDKQGKIKKHTICPLCGGRLQAYMHSLDYYATNESFTLDKCMACSFIITQEAPCEEQMGRYYATDAYISHSDTRKGVMNKVYHIVRQYSLKRKATLIEQWSTKRGELLDVGCATGYFMDVMQRRGWKTTGIEQDEKAAHKARSHFSLSVNSKKDALHSLPQQHYDVITLWHVLEHIEPLHDTVMSLKNALKEDGIIVLALPNCNSTDALHYQSMWAAYDVPRHLWHFTPATLQLLASKHELDIVASYPMPFDAFYVAMLSEKYKKALFPTLKGALVGKWCWLKSLCNKEKSSSIIYILKKH